MTSHLPFILQALAVLLVVGLAFAHSVALGVLTIAVVLFVLGSWLALPPKAD